LGFPAVPLVTSARLHATLVAARRRLWRRSALLFTVRLTTTSAIAYLLALLILPPTPAPLLAPLTALLVMQVSLYQTMRSVIERVVSVIAGVVLAVGFADLLGFTWWSLAAVIAVALALGQALKLGDHLLEVPISAMLILQAGTQAAATDRIVETLLGAGVGLVAGIIASPVRVRPAAQALGGLGEAMASLQLDMADGLGVEPGDETVRTWLERSGDVGRRLRRVEKELISAEESTRLKPRARTGLALRATQETLEVGALTLRGLARCIADRTGLYLHDRAGLGEQMWEADVRERLAGVLRHLSAATRDYTRAGTVADPAEAAALGSRIEAELAAGRAERDALGLLLREDPGHWPLHGELLVHLDRLLDGLRDGKAPLAPRALPAPRPLHLSRRLVVRGGVRPHPRTTYRRRRGRAHDRAV
jgi:hypothetical protein